MPKGLTPQAKERLIAILKRDVMPSFSVEAKAADEMKVDATALNRLLNHGQGGSVEFVEAVARYLSIDPATILFGGDAKPEPRLSDMPGFSEVLSEARALALRQMQSISDAQFEAAGRLRITPQPVTLTAELLVQLALTSARASKPRKK